MSRGFGGYARLDLENEETAIYKYGAYNLNCPDFRPKDLVYDGQIVITKSCLVESEVHEKMKRMPSGRKKLVTKRIHVDVSFSDMILNGLIEVKNCGNCWRTNEETGIDFMTDRILSCIFDSYQENGELPKSVSYNV